MQAEGAEAGLLDRLRIDHLHRGIDVVQAVGQRRGERERVEPGECDRIDGRGEADRPGFCESLPSKIAIADSPPYWRWG